MGCVSAPHATRKEKLGVFIVELHLPAALADQWIDEAVKCEAGEEHEHVRGAVVSVVVQYGAGAVVECQGIAALLEMWRWWKSEKAGMGRWASWSSMGPELRKLKRIWESQATCAKEGEGVQCGGEGLVVKKETGVDLELHLWQQLHQEALLLSIVSLMQGIGKNNCKSMENWPEAVREMRQGY
ncbi:hypothetical protein DFH08DRAFT_828412 [Mycena albidolilacea]|uniref:Uncharacterized protein n=1 Tax=Mycena albidolilacea TaxID=1033008 RepID=A0AAD7E6A4_9AGAR|nr:hypothetical protein DFH08DRAFT_828412 [Mycena albidolilacea]